MENGRPSDTECWAIKGEMFWSFNMLVAEAALVIDPGVLFVLMSLQIAEACNPLDTGT